MAITAIVENGKVVDTGATNSITGKESSNNVVDEDMFLQLLVAEMQHQDPLEPTSNTEWVSQYATFTQVEQTSSMQESMKQIQASSLVGKQVIMKTTNSITGETSYFSGQVDYMYVEEGKTYLSVNDKLYSIDDLDTVVDSKYMEAVGLASDFKSMVDKLPSKSLLTTSDEGLLKQVREAYEAMDDYQKQFVDRSLLEKLESLEEQMKVLKNAEGSEGTDAEGNGDSEGDTGIEEETPGDTENDSKEG